MEERGHAFTVPMSGPSGQNRFEPSASHTTSNPGRDARQKHQQPQPQQQVIVIEAPRQKNQFSALYYEFVVVIGLIEIVVGLFSIALGIANPVQCGYFGVIGYGIWGGTIVSLVVIFKSNQLIQERCVKSERLFRDAK